MTSGEKIKEARKRAGLTQKQLGEKLGLTYQSIAQWETSSRSPKPESIIKIAEALGINPIELYDDAMQAVFNNMHSWAERNNAVVQTLPDGSFEIYPSAELQQEIFSGRREDSLLTDFRRLNDKGQELAIEYVQLLAENEKYLK